MEKRTPKEWKSFNEQLALLRHRGLRIDDECNALGYLKTLGYYRLSGYLYAFRQVSPDNAKCRLDPFVADSNFEEVKQLYLFDKKLRQLALDALERIEIAMRVNLAYLLGRYSPTAYKESKFFDPKFDHSKWLKRYENLIEREKENNVFIQHHLEHYDDLPIWVCCEIWDFGTMSMLYKGLKKIDKDNIAKRYHLKSGEHLQTHLHAFNSIRNIAAHHGRLWNRAIVFKPKLKGLPDLEWKQLNVKKPFVYFCLMKRMLDIICPNSSWGDRFLAVLNEFPQPENKAISLEQMGIAFPLEEWDLWKKKAPDLVNPTT